MRDFSGGKPRALSPEGYSSVGVSSPDGKWTLARGPDRKRYLYPIAGGEPTVVAGLEPTRAWTSAAPTAVTSTFIDAEKLH